VDTRGGVYLWDIHTRKRLPFEERTSELLQTVTFTPDGRRVLAGSSGGLIRLWDIETSRELLRLRKRELAPNVSSIAIGGDGNTLSAVGVSAADVWHAPSFDEIDADGDQE